MFEGWFGPFPNLTTLGLFEVVWNSFSTGIPLRTLSRRRPLKLKRVECLLTGSPDLLVDILSNLLSTPLTPSLKVFWFRSVGTKSGAELDVERYHDVFTLWFHHCRNTLHTISLHWFHGVFAERCLVLSPLRHLHSLELVNVPVTDIRYIVTIVSTVSSQEPFNLWLWFTTTVSSYTWDQIQQFDWKMMDGSFSSPRMPVRFRKIYLRGGFFQTRCRDSDRSVELKLGEFKRLLPHLAAAGLLENWDLLVGSSRVGSQLKEQSVC